MIIFKRIVILCISAFLISIACWIGFSSYNDGVIFLQWNSNREADLAGYQVHYGTATGTYTHSILIALASQPHPGTTSYKLKGLVKNQKYYIAVTAYNQYGYESAFSNEVEGIAR
jgi:hypothetical protein